MQHLFSLLTACWLRCKFYFYQKIRNKNALALHNKTKYFVLCWFDEVCSENNEVNEKGESKRPEIKC